MSVSAARTKGSKTEVETAPTEVPTEWEGDEGKPGSFVRNYLWPVLGGLAATVIPVIMTNLPQRLMDGWDATDGWFLLGTAGTAALGYFLVILQRHGGSKEPYTQQPK